MTSRSANGRVRRIIIARWLRPLLTSDDRLTAALARSALERSEVGKMRFVHWLLAHHGNKLDPGDVPTRGPSQIK
jgi:hypothetical protein